FVVAVRRAHGRIAELLRSFEEVLLNLPQQAVDMPGRAVQGDAERLPIFAWEVASSNRACTLLKVLRSDLDSHRCAAKFYFSETVARHILEVAVNHHPEWLVAVEVVARQFD